LQDIPALIIVIIIVTSPLRKTQNVTFVTPNTEKQQGIFVIPHKTVDDFTGFVIIMKKGRGFDVQAVPNRTVCCPSKADGTGTGGDHGQCPV
jgi:hypothetical protein